VNNSLFVVNDSLMGGYRSIRNQGIAFQKENILLNYSMLMNVKILKV
jgi:hypothetical protein